MSLSRVELILGWLAVLLGAAVAAFTYYGAFIDSHSIQRDLVVFGVVLGMIAVGVTADGLFRWPLGRILLGVATLALLAITAISFVSFLYAPALLAIGATVLAFVRPYQTRFQQRR